MALEPQASSTDAQSLKVAAWRASDGTGRPASIIRRAYARRPRARGRSPMEDRLEQAYAESGCSSRVRAVSYVLAEKTEVNGGNVVMAELDLAV